MVIRHTCKPIKFIFQYFSQHIGISISDPVASINVAQSAGSTVTLLCVKRTTKVVWMFTPVGESVSVVIVDNCASTPLYNNKYRAQRVGTACNLLIVGITTTQAGTYTCQDISLTDRPTMSQLVVLGKDSFYL